MYLQQIRRECNRNCVSFSNLLSRFYQMPELSDNLLTHFFRHSLLFLHKVILDHS